MIRFIYWKGHPENFGEDRLRKGVSLEVSTQVDRPLVVGGVMEKKQFNQLIQDMIRALLKEVSKGMDGKEWI